MTIFDTLQLNNHVITVARKWRSKRGNNRCDVLIDECNRQTIYRYFSRKCLCQEAEVVRLAGCSQRVQSVAILVRYAGTYRRL